MMLDSLRALTHATRERVGRDAAAVVHGSADSTRTTSWAELDDAARVAAARGETMPHADALTVLVDGTAASLSTVLGLLGAVRDVVLLEPDSSVLHEPPPALAGLGRFTVVDPGVEPTRPGEEMRPSDDLSQHPPASRSGEVLQLTSGATGMPRVVRQPQRNMILGACAYRDAFRIDERDTLLAAVPLAHSFGFVGGFTTSLLTGATLWSLPRFSPRTFLRSIAAGATVALTTPLMCRLLLPVLRARGCPSGSSLRLLLCSGGPLAPELADEIGQLLGVAVRQVYGSTETGLLACHPVDRASWPPGSVGTPAPGVEFRVRAGRLVVRSPTLCSGYGGADEELRPDGWYDTGDLGSLDDDGHVFVRGRKETFVNIGGRKVNPSRIEDVVGDCPGVREACVFGAVGTEGEQRMHAVLVLDDGVEPSDVIAHCRTRGLRPYEVPRHVHPVAALPRTGMGKVDRRQCARMISQRKLGHV